MCRPRRGRSRRRGCHRRRAPRCSAARSATRSTSPWSAAQCSSAASSSAPPSPPHSPHAPRVPCQEIFKTAPQAPEIEKSAPQAPKIEKPAPQAPENRKTGADTTQYKGAAREARREKMHSGGPDKVFLGCSFKNARSR
eukprot:gene2047-biopygen22941